MGYPEEVLGARICVLRYTDEITVCANIAGFRALGEWLAWLAASDTREKFHFHLLWHLESEASKWGNGSLKNVWVLSQSEPSSAPRDVPPGGEVREFELTFQVVSELDLDVLAEYQASGQIPPAFQKHASAVVVQCG